MVGYRTLQSSEQSQPWGQVIAATLVVNLTTFTAVFAIGLARITKKVSGKGYSEGFMNTLYNLVIPSFACGALLATAFLFVIPEALEQIGAGHQQVGTMHRELRDDYNHEERRLRGEESEIAWKFGASIMAGFIFPILMSTFFHNHDHGCEHEHVHEHREKHSSQSSTETNSHVAEGACDGEIKDLEYGKSNENETTKSGDVTNDTESRVVEVNYSLIATILLGDFLHLFCDGVFIGVGFKLCGTAFALTMAASTVYHELCHQLSDFMLLMNECGLTFYQTMMLNFLSGTSVMIGGVMALGINFSTMAIGTILSASAGIFIQIAACECVPMFQRERKTHTDTLIFFISFLLGAVPIGLVLLNHKHCEQ